jgi:hypothetical protein
LRKLKAATANTRDNVKWAREQTAKSNSKRRLANR